MINFESLLSPPLSLKIIFAIISFGFLFGIVYFLLKTDWLKRVFLQDLVEFLSFKSYEMRKFPKTWDKIIKRLEKGTGAELKLAVIEADDLLNDVLEKMGYSGETLGEKLEQLDKKTLPNLDEISEVHQIRSDIIHDPTFRLNFSQAAKILEVYRKALSSLEAI